MTRQESTEGLRTMIAQALRAYELAQATRRQAEREAKEEHRQHRQQLDADHEREETLATAEQERIGALLAAIEGAERAARDLLEKAGLAHVVGAPLQLDETAAPLRRDDEAVTEAFATAQTAQVDLRVALLALAQAFLEAGRWPETRRVVQPLLEDEEAPLYTDAHQLLCESHYRPAATALESGEWESARQSFEAALKLDPAFRDAAALYRESYLRPAGLALEAGEWEVVRQHAAAWFTGHKDDTDARQLLCESYYRPAAAALESGEWESARQSFEAVLALDPAFRDAAALYRESYLRPAGLALEAGEWEVVRQYAEPWFKKHKKDADALGLLCESFYRQALAAAQAGERQAAYRAFDAVLTLDAAYRDAADQQQQIIRQWLALDLVQIPAGEFLYGDNKEPTYLDEFWMSRTPVTNAQYQVFVDATGYRAPDHWSRGRPPGGKEQHPVMEVNWDDAQAFCKWAGVRLPWEREWEKAARGTDGRTYPWGDERPNAQRGKFDDNVGDTTAVGRYPQGASPYGLLDMVGNVREWCEDEYEYEYASIIHRVTRGGKFDQYLGSVNCASYGVEFPESRENYVGFRVVAPGL